MKITNIEILPASKYLFVKVHTDEGIVGIGESGAWGFLDATVGAIKKFESYLIGKKSFSNRTPLELYVSQYVF